MESMSIRKRRFYFPTPVAPERAHVVGTARLRCPRIRQLPDGVPTSRQLSTQRRGYFRARWRREFEYRWRNWGARLI
jgi:hypothetical protein